MPRSRWDDGEVEEGELDAPREDKWEAPTPDPHSAPAPTRSRAGKRFRTWDPPVAEDLPTDRKTSVPDELPKDGLSAESAHHPDERTSADLHDGRDSYNRYDERRASDRRYESHPSDAEARCV